MAKKITTKERMLSHIVMLLWCVVYVSATSRILSSYYLAGSVEVVSYHKSFSLIKFIICVCVIEILRFITSKASTKILLLYYVKELLFVFFVIPAVLGYSLFIQPYYHEFLIFCFIYWCFFCFFCKYVSFLFLPMLGWNMPKKAEGIVLSLITIMLIVLIIRSIGGIKFSLSLSDVYSTREEFKESGSLLLTIIKAALGCYICPCMIVKYLREKRLAFACIFVFCQMLAYSMAKDKSYLLFLGLSLVLGLRGSRFIKDIRMTMSLLYGGLSGMNIIAIIGPFQNLIYNIFTRRFFMMPAWLQYINYEVFRNQPKIWWRQDTFLIDKLFTPVYSRSLVQIIADDYFHGWIGNPNNGMAGEAFTRCGYLGAVIYPLLIVIFLCILYYFFKGFRKEMILMFSIALAMVLSNDVITSTSFVITILIIIGFTFFVHKNRELEKTGYVLETMIE